MYELLDRTSFNTVWLSYLPSAWFHANVLCHDFVIYHTLFSSSSVLRSSSQVAGLSPVFVFPFFFSWNVAENYIFLVTLLALGTWLFIFLLLLFGQHRWFLMGLFIGEHVFTIFFLISLTPFCLLYFFIMQIEKIRGAGLIKGGSLENAMVCRWRINILENVTCLFNFVQNYILVGTLLI